MARAVFEQRYSETILTDNLILLLAKADIPGQRITEKAQVAEAINVY